MTRLITVITTTTTPLDDDEPLTTPAMRTIESVQAQTMPPDRWDLVIMRDVGDFTRDELHKMGAQQAKTEWLLFVPEGDVLPSPEHLANLFNVQVEGDVHGPMVRREFFLAGADE